MTDTKSILSLGDLADPSADDYLGWTFTEDQAIFSPVVGFAAEWDAMCKPFVVVNIKTTSPDPESCETIEIAALLVDPTGTVTSKFSKLVKVASPVPDDVLKLMGITQEQLAREGQPIAQVMKDYLAFVASRPVFLKDAFIDLPFLKKAAGKTCQTFDEPVYDIDGIALMIWTEVQVMGFDALAAHVRAPQVRPRCIDDAKAALIILLAGRKAAFAEDGAIFNPIAGFASAWEAMCKPFAIVDTETTGGYAESDEILEFAALLVEPSGVITSEFSALVKVKQPLKQEYLELLEITQSMVDLEGIPLPDAMAKFIAFVGNRPAFIHNTKFEQAFFDRAEEKTGQVFDNKVYDTLVMAQMIWNDGGPHNCSRLLKRLGLPQVQGSTLGEAKSTLAVLLAAREAAHHRNCKDLKHLLGSSLQKTSQSSLSLDFNKFAQLGEV
jgi:DNA polymerase-3 subunit epsilon